MQQNHANCGSGEATKIELAARRSSKMYLPPYFFIFANRMAVWPWLGLWLGMMSRQSS
jgi:hypothetical protein